MGSLGVQEMVVIFLVALVLFGPKKLPELGRTIGKAITEFRRASNDLKATFEREMQTLERESQSMSQVAQVTASDIFTRAINYDPDHETRSLPPAETESQNPVDHLDSAQLPTTATELSTVGASAVSGAESSETIAEAAPSPEPDPGPVAALEGTVPRSEQSQHS